MTAAPDGFGARLVVRPPVVLRVVVVVFLLAWVGLLAGILTGPGGAPRGAGVLIAAGGAFAIVAAVQAQVRSVTATPTELVVRNALRADRLPREEIDGFDVRVFVAGGGRDAAYALLRGGTRVRLRALDSPRWVPGHRPVRDLVAELERWRAGPSGDGRAG